MGQLDTQVARRLTRYYILARSVVAVLSVVGQWLIHSALDDLLGDARIINLAGRQRMLSQRLTKRAILLCNPNIYLPVSSEYQYVSKFGDILQLWRKYHIELKNGYLPQEDIKVRKSPAIDSLFALLEPPYGQMSSALEIILDEYSKPNPNQLRAQAALLVVLANERSFLQVMDKIVFQYDEETNQRIIWARSIEFTLTCIVLIVLLLEGLFVFRPVVSYTQETLNRLLKSEQNLQTTNDSLLKTNESLYLTREALIEASTEKYRLQEEENQVRAASLLEGQEAERRRMSRELHDGIGQMLTGLKLQLEQLKDVPFATPKQRQHFHDLQSLLGETIEATRTVSFNLMPTTLQDFGLVSAIKLLVEQTARAVSIAFDVSGIQDIGRLAPAVEISLYRIVQEAINNTIKHANAKQISISLYIQKTVIVLKIQDDGIGFDYKPKTHAQKNRPGHGLSNIRTRTELLGGKFNVQTASGMGTTITVKIPTQES